MSATIGRRMVPGKLWGKNSFSRYITGFICGFVLIQLAIILSAVRYDAQVLREQKRQSVRNVLNIYENDVRNAIQNADVDLHAILNEATPLSLLSSPSSLGRHHAAYEVGRELDNRLASGGGTDAYVVANRASGAFLMARSGRVDYDRSIHIQDYVLDTLGTGWAGDSGWHIARVGGEAFLTRYYYYGQNLVCALIRVDTLGELYHGIFEGDQALLVADLEGTALYRAGSFSGEEKEGGLEEVRDMEDLGIRIHCFAEANWGIARATPQFIAVMAAIALVFIAAFTVYSNREIIAPMSQLMDTSAIIQEGNLDYRPVLRCRNREFQALARSINAMLDMIIQLRINTYERLLKQRDTELKYLQMQIRPHFFLNALSTISSMSYQGNFGKVREFVNALSLNIRYMFKAGLHTVTIREEAEHIRNYLGCQELLYPGCVFSFLEVDQEVEEWRIPQMLLHTFVENVYKHALSLEDMTSLLIHAHLTRRDGEVMATITVEDNGTGFPQEVIDAVALAGEEDREGSHQIGLANMARTLRLMYGRSGLMELRNKGSGGAIVQVWVPGKDRLQEGRKQ